MKMILTANQRETIRIIVDTNENNFQKMQSLRILNIHNMYLFHFLNFMFRVGNDTILSVFNKEFRSIDLIYPTRHSQITLYSCW